MPERCILEALLRRVLYCGHSTQYSHLVIFGNTSTLTKFVAEFESTDLVWQFYPHRWMHHHNTILNVSWGQPLSPALSTNRNSFILINSYLWLIIKDNSVPINIYRRITFSFTWRQSVSFVLMTNVNHLLQKHVCVTFVKQWNCSNIILTKRCNARLVHVYPDRRHSHKNIILRLAYGTCNTQLAR